MIPFRLYVADHPNKKQNICNYISSKINPNEFLEENFIFDNEFVQNND